MASGCCTQTSAQGRAQGALVVCLAGNPNVGKSTLFNRLTSSAVETANYPGVTVGLNVAKARWGEQEVQVLDLPGTYALDPVSEDQWVARHGLLDWRPDVVLAVVDATNLARNLYMVLQLVDLGCRVVVALNLVDEARRQDLRVDPAALSEGLGLPVVPTVARRGEGLEELTAVAATVAASADGLGHGKAVRFSPPIERRLATLMRRLEEKRVELPYGLPQRAAALAILEGDEELVGLLGEGRRDVAADETPLAVPIAAQRHAAAGAIAEACSEGHERQQVADRWWRATTSPLSGVPILLAVLAGVFAFLFFVGGWLSALLTSLWTATASPLLTTAVHALFGQGALAGTLLWGLDGGILAALAVGIPYILTFYFVLALLEDSGYMNAAAFLADRVHAPLRPPRSGGDSAHGGRRLQRAGHHGHAGARHQARAHDRLHAYHSGPLQCAHGRHSRFGLTVRRLAVGALRLRPGRPPGALRRPAAQPCAARRARGAGHGDVPLPATVTAPRDDQDLEALCDLPAGRRAAHARRQLPARGPL
ncbi:MAG TPA: ferrous iron transporter B [Thermoleophilia bacterium]